MRAARLAILAAALTAACGPPPTDDEFRRAATARVAPVLARGTPMARVVGFLKQHTLSYTVVSDTDCNRAARAERPCWGGGYLDVEVPQRPLAAVLGGKVAHVVIMFGESAEVEAHRVDLEE